ncbi:MAG: phosphoribosylaminoimidazolesuccinocarboxamide synthase [Verrucomicrobiia bacterium]
MTNPSETLLTINIRGLKKLRSGKVREIFDLGDRLLFLATDRISAFDVIMPTGIPLKGRVLTSISKFWFEKIAHIIPNHVLTTEFAGFPPELQSYRQQLEGRAMIVRKCKPLAVECIVRGYLAGSGWKEYKQSQSVCGVKLPSGLLESSELPEPIFTPSTKAESGHDINISQRQAAKVLGEALATRVHDASLAIYKWARAFARERGIIIADTKFEFGLLPDGEVILIDEVLTPDSSRFWPASEYQPGRGQPSFDKQFVRDYLETLDWNKTPPGPGLPAEIVSKTSEKYLEAYRRITGTELIS